MTPAQKAEVQLWQLIINIVEEAVKEAGPNGVPSGHLYAALQSKLSLGAYQQVLAMMVKLERVTLSNHVVTHTSFTQAKRTPKRKAKGG